jgi:hypothetical protein
MTITSSILVILWMTVVGLILASHWHPAPQVSEVDEEN